MILSIKSWERHAQSTCFHNTTSYWSWYICVNTRRWIICWSFIGWIYGMDRRLDTMMALSLVNSKSVALSDNLSGG